MLSFIVIISLWNDINCAGCNSQLYSVSLGRACSDWLNDDLDVAACCVVTSSCCRTLHSARPSLRWPSLTASGNCTYISHHQMRRSPSVTAPAAAAAAAANDVSHCQWQLHCDRPIVSFVYLWCILLPVACPHDFCCSGPPFLMRQENAWTVSRISGVKKFWIIWFFSEICF